MPPYGPDPKLPRISNKEELQAWAAKERAKFSSDPNREAHFRRIAEYFRASERKLAEMAPDKPQETPPDKPEKSGNIIGGIGRGLYDTGRETVTGLYTLATTNPITTARNIGVGIARTVDTALVAEETPAYAHLNQALSSMANASAYDWGYALGRVGGNAVLSIAPGIAAARISTAMRAGTVETVIVPKGPPKITWVDETPTFSGPAKARAKAYNDSAKGAHSNILTKKGQAPALDRKMPDGSSRQVRFDGVEQDSVYGHVMIDRKWSVRMNEKVKIQATRQSKALEQNHIIGVWEVPTKKQYRRAIKLLKKLEISNIKVRIVEP